MATEIELFCIIDGESIPFSIKVNQQDTIGELKDAIKKEKEHECEEFDANKLTLWHSDLASSPTRQITLENLLNDDSLNKKPKEIEDGTYDVLEVFG